MTADGHRPDATPGGAGILPPPSSTPSTVEELQEVVRRAALAGTPLGVYRPAPPGGTAVGLGHLDRILEIDRANLLARVEPGVRLRDLRAALQPHGLRFVPADGPVGEARTMGELYHHAHGHVASLKYGSAKHLLLGSRLVLASGEVLRTGGRTVKNVSGYDLTRFLNAPYTTLGIAVEFILKLHPVAPACRALAARFADVSAVIGLAVALREARVLPVHFVWLDPETQRMLRPGEPARAHLVLLALDGMAEEVAEAGATTLATLERHHGDVLTALDPRGDLGHWANLHDAAGDVVLANELKVEGSRQRAFLERFEAALRERGVRAGIHGQLLEGKLSLRLACDPVRPDGLVQAILDDAAASGARIAGHFARASGAVTGPLADVERRLRRLLDPAALLGGREG